MYLTFFDIISPLQCSQEHRYAPQLKFNINYNLQYRLQRVLYKLKILLSAIARVSVQHNFFNS